MTLAKVKVEKGAITVSASSQMFYLGNEVVLSGTNTDSKYAQTYYEGPNVGWENLDKSVVKTDNTCGSTSLTPQTNSARKM